MASPVPIGVILYSASWTKEVDDKFIRHLDFHAHLEGRRLTTKDQNIITDTMTFLNTTSKGAKKWDYYACHRRFEITKERYVTWDWILHNEGVSYNATMNTVTASAEVWKQIIKIHKLGVYYSYGRNKHKWKELRAIFGPNEARNLDLSNDPFTDGSDGNGGNRGIYVIAISVYEPSFGSVQPNMPNPVNNLGNMADSGTQSFESADVRSISSGAPPDLMARWTSQSTTHWKSFHIDEHHC